MIEFEMTIPNVEIDDARRRLRECGAVLQKDSYIQKHIVFNLPEERKIEGAWMRVREESDRITMSMKIIDGKNISDQQEYFFIAENTEDACKFLTLLGGTEKARQEKRREIWMLGQCEITIDEWPFLEPFLEVEGKNEEMVRETVSLLGYEYDKCRVCAVDVLYSEKYGISEDIVDNHTSRILFDMENPFLR
ncbi:MAG: CYTH domain-containing protein [Candidatus Pacebacteria bacterium]|nr:CYTH domain-containing protein [Candidatus Paceibacterota bacterium]